MSITDGQQAIIKRLVEESPINVVLPNGPDKGLPRYHVQEVGGIQNTIGVDGTTEADAEVLVRVETRNLEYSTENNELTKELYRMFPVGLRYGGVTILEAPDPRPPLPMQDGVYAVPVYIRARSYFNYGRNDNGD